MKKLFALILCSVFIVGNMTSVFAQPKNEPTAAQTQKVNKVDSPPTNAGEPKKVEDGNAQKAKEEQKGSLTLTQSIKNKFIEGDPVWMTPVLVCLLLGLAIVIEKIISLFLTSINAKKFTEDVDKILKSDGLEAAKTFCRNTKGPIASIYYQGLDRAKDGKIEEVEAAVQSYGSVQMGQLEKGMVWISLFIALAPMLGFLGTVVGMIQAFDKIEKEGDISPTVVASGIKVALLTTVAGLIVAIILQIFYNLLLSKIDSIANEMEEASIDLTDILVKNKVV